MDSRDKPTQTYPGSIDTDSGLPLDPDLLAAMDLRSIVGSTVALGRFEEEHFVAETCGEWRFVEFTDIFSLSLVIGEDDGGQVIVIAGPWNMTVRLLVDGIRESAAQPITTDMVRRLFGDAA